MFSLISKYGVEVQEFEWHILVVGWKVLIYESQDFFYKSYLFFPSKCNMQCHIYLPFDYLINILLRDCAFMLLEE
jgi:hypothetical protein